VLLVMTMHEFIVLGMGVGVRYCCLHGRQSCEGLKVPYSAYKAHT
jgi:hypothetical protein